jgi:cob(I)alamin adenosyltransferase
MASDPQPEEDIEGEKSAEIRVVGFEVWEMKIYTKTGDSGDTGIMGGARLSKSDLRIEAIGSVDELNAAVGWARVESHGTVLDGTLEEVQRWLFELGSELASPGDQRFETIKSTQAEHLERAIDELGQDLPELRNFVLPGGCELASRLHIARSVCRRAERTVVELASRDSIRIEPRIFLNRLADYLFVAARTANLIQNVMDVTWTRGS